MKKKILLMAFILVSINAFPKTLKLNSQLMFTDNWYTSNTFDEEGSFEITIPDGWNLNSTVFHNEKNEKVAEGSFLYKIEIGQRYNGVIVEKLHEVDYDPPKIMEKKTGKTKNGYIYDLEITATIARADEGYIVWYPCRFFIYNLDYCFSLNFYARDNNYQKELDSFMEFAIALPQRDVETLKEKIRVKFKDGEGFFYKKYDSKDIKVISKYNPAFSYEKFAGHVISMIRMIILVNHINVE